MCNQRKRGFCQLSGSELPRLRASLLFRAVSEKLFLMLGDQQNLILFLE